LSRHGPRRTFCAPLAGAAGYASAREDDRRRVHRALSDATDETLDPDSRAWHDAVAARAPDETVAPACERSAAHGREQPGYASPAALLELAAQLTPDAHKRAERSLA